MLWLSARIGVSFRKRRRNLEEDEREDFGVIVAAALTLLGLIIGFSFSMAVSRYDQSKNHEEAEANASGLFLFRVPICPWIMALYDDMRGLIPSLPLTVSASHL